MLRGLKSWFYGLSKELTKEFFHNTGKNNRVVLILQNGLEKDAKPRHLKMVDIKFTGDDNILKIHLPCDLRTSRFQFRCNNSMIEIGQNSHLTFDVDMISDNSRLFVGENCHCGGAELVLCGNTVRIGDNCMLSDKILFLDDTHSILDYRTHVVLNKKKSVLNVGNHVWIGENVTLLKNASVPDDCIIGYGSLVTKSFVEKHAVLGGSPARVIKTGITWHSLSPSGYTTKKAKGMPV